MLGFPGYYFDLAYVIGFFLIFLFFIISHLPKATVMKEDIYEILEIKGKSELKKKTEQLITEKTKKRKKSILELSRHCHNSDKNNI